MKKISFNTASGQLLSILKGDATRFIDYTPRHRPNYHIGEQLQIDPEQVRAVIQNQAIRHSIAFRAGYLNHYNDLFTLEADTFFMIQITNIRQLRATDFTLTDTLRLGIKTCRLNDYNGYMIPNFENYTSQVFSSSICALQAYIRQICPLSDSLSASNPIYNLYEFTTIINPDLEEISD